MRTVLVDNLLLEDTGGCHKLSLQPHLGLISLIAVIEQNGHQGLLYDPKLEVLKGSLNLDASLYERASRQILALQPDVVGFTSLGCNFICTAQIASHLRKRAPHIPIILGGPHATVLDKQIAQQFSQFDIIVRNEAESIICDLLDAIVSKQFEDVLGITYKQDGQVRSNPAAGIIDDLDSLPSPAFDRYPIDELGLTSLRVEAGRGCPFSCTFCSTATFFGRQYRLYSPERLRREMDKLFERYGISEFSLTHDLFTVNRKKVIAFCDEIRDTGYRWKCSARMDCVDEELLRIMSEAGCAEIYYGVETGSVRMQHVARKHLDLRLFDPILDVTERLGIAPTVSFITGYPEESQQDQDDTLDYIGRCSFRTRVPINVQLHLLTPEPGTELLSTHSESLKYDGHISDFNFPSLHPNDSNIIRANRDIFVNHHYYATQISRNRNIFVATLHLLLQQLSPLTVVHILRRYDNLLSGFVNEMYEWHSSRSPGTQIQASHVYEFVVFKWGNEDYLVSLVRYGFECARVAKRLDKLTSRPTSTRPERGQSDVTRHLYILSENAGVLDHVHPCVEILSELSNGHHENVSPGLLVRRVNYVVFYSGAGPTEVIRNFHIDGIGLELVRQFEKPKPIASVVKMLDNVVSSSESERFISQLIDNGILERAQRRTLRCHSTGHRSIRQGMLLVHK